MAIALRELHNNNPWIGWSDPDGFINSFINAIYM